MSARRSQAFSAADIDALFAPFVRAKTLLIAVSGGPDSTALLLMAAEWAKRRGKTRIEAATVDHGLRPESANEAKAVGEMCVRLGQTLAALGNSEQACATLTEFGKRYPTASASVKKLAEHESSKDHC